MLTATLKTRNEASNGLTHTPADTLGVAFHTVSGAFDLHLVVVASLNSAAATGHPIGAITQPWSADPHVTPIADSSLKTLAGM